jgi:arginyl-tRNA synthetase
MNIYKKIESEIRGLVEKLKQEGALPDNVVTDKIEATPPKDASHGDIATNAAMVIAAQTGKNPREIAQLIVDKLSHQMLVAQSQIAGPGFINITLNEGVWQKSVLDILERGRDYGQGDAGKNVRVNIEYVSANPTGPMHVGHGRGAVFGDALALLLQKAGYDVTKEYYINDAGGQIDKLADSAYLRYREACGEVVSEIPEGLYPGDYLIPVGKALAAKYGKDFMGAAPETYRPVIRLFAVNAMMELIKQDLAALGIHHDVFTSEREITEAGKVGEAIGTLEEKKLIYVGVLEPPKGKTPDDWEPRPQTLFRATDFGDDCDRPIKKSDGTWTYFAPDIAYHYDKCKRGFDLLIDVFGADHGGYVKRLKAAVNALSGGKVQLDVKLMQMIKLLRNGEPAKMSKRAGNFVMVSDVVEEVGKDVFRFIMLTRKNDAPLDFDFAKVMEQSKDNPVFYVQYAHARARSVIRNIKADMPEAAAQGEKPSFEILRRLAHKEELALIRLLCSWPRMVESAALAREPHRIAFFLQDVAAAFHGFWNLGNDDLGLRFIVKHDIELTAARMALAHAVSVVIASGLNVLGVEPLEEMR